MAVIQISTEEMVRSIFIAILPLGALVTFAVWLLKKWLGARIDKSIQHFYDKELEDYRLIKTRRLKADLVAKIFSTWIKYRGREENLLTQREIIDRYDELNKLSLELSLWIEDVKLLNDVMNRLQHAEGARPIRDVMGDVRKLILENPDDKFDSDNIVLWPVESEVESVYGPIKKS